MVLSGAEEVLVIPFPYPLGANTSFMTQVVLETEYDNAPALALYGALGFIREKRLFRFYLNGKDAFRLVLPLDVPRLSELPLELEQGASNVDIEDEGVWTDDSE
jgi:peptide alpha-N-acetyltransferase